MNVNLFHLGWKVRDGKVEQLLIDLQYARENSAKAGLYENRET